MKTLIEQHQQWCVHYKREPGFPKHEKCEAGVEYDVLTRVKELGDFGAFLRLPCIRSHHDELERRGQPLCPCDKLRWPTMEESEADEIAIREHMNKINAALLVIDPIRKEHRGKNWAGTLDCPVCGKKLHVRHHGMNNHVWCKCETEDCVSWLE